MEKININNIYNDINVNINIYYNDYVVSDYDMGFFGTTYARTYTNFVNAKNARQNFSQILDFYGIKHNPLKFSNKYKYRLQVMHLTFNQYYYIIDKKKLKEN